MGQTTEHHPQTQAWINLEQELLYQAMSKADPRRCLYIELDGTMDALSDWEWRDHSSESFVMYQIMRADVLMALINRFDAEAGLDIAVPIATRLAGFKRDYVLGRI